MLLYVDPSGWLIWQVTERTQLCFPKADLGVLESLIGLRDSLMGRSMGERFSFTSDRTPETIFRIGSRSEQPTELGMRVTRSEVRMLFDGKRRRISSDKEQFLAEMNTMLAELVGFDETRSSTKLLRTWNGALECDFLNLAIRVLRNV